MSPATSASRIFTQKSIKSTTQSRAALALWATFGLIALWRLACIIAVQPYHTNDSGVFTQPHSYFFGQRPPLVPLLYAALGHNEKLIIVLQSVAGALCWGALAFAVAAWIRTPVIRVIAGASIMLLPLCWRVAIWDQHIMSESLNLSLFALHIAAWAWLAKRNEWPCVGAVAVSGLLWAASRDTAAYAMLLTVPGLLLWSLKKREVKGLALTACFVAAFGFSLISARAGKRQETPLINSLFWRILPIEENRQFFVERGLPYSPAVASMHHQMAWHDEYRTINKPEFREFRKWVLEHGSGTYARFLLTRPAYAALHPLKETRQMISPELDGYVPRDFRPMLPGLVESWLWWEVLGARVTFTDDYVWGGIWLALIIGGTVALVWKRHPLAPLFAGLLVIGWPVACLIWHGDAADTERHSLQIAVQYRLLLLMVVWLGLDWMVQKVSLSRANPAPATHR